MDDPTLVTLRARLRDATPEVRRDVSHLFGMDFDRMLAIRDSLPADDTMSPDDYARLHWEMLRVWALRYDQLSK